MGDRSLRVSLRRRQRGAVLIEFAFVFPVFFLLVYALLAYGITFMLQQGMVLAAEEGVRAAIAIDPDQFSKQSDYEDKVIKTAKEVAKDRLQWLPRYYREVFDKNLTATLDPTTRVLTLQVVYPKATGSHPIIPLIEFPGLGKIPPMPERLQAEASFRL